MQIQKFFKRTVLVFFAFGFVAFPALAVHAAIPTFINYQSRLRDSSSNAITSATTIQFSIYNTSSSGSPSDTASSSGPLLWTETYDQASGSCIQIDPDSEGYFTVELGSCTAFPSYLDFTSATLYVGVKVASDSEATPRAQLGTAPYAFNATRFNDLESTSFLRSDTNDAFSSGTLTFNDSTILAFGSSNDLTISHGGTNTVFDNTFATGATQFQLGTDTNATAFQILNNTGANLFEVDGSGNVGIGDTSPDFGLEISASSTTGYFGVTNATNGDLFTIDGLGNVG
ncbi:MAG: hypothetical protein IIA83_11255, partial [Thaumarchaeota archaeon]|nr:hypothetical protein [Nitrososphaerota archaeon]